MFNLLNDIGKKLSGWLGDEAKDSFSKEEQDQAFGTTPLSSILPYVAYDETSGMFINRKASGFIIEALPLVGGDTAAYKIMQSIFQDILEEGSSLQCLLLADHRTDSFLDEWKNKRQHEEIYRVMANRRADFFKDNKTNPTRLFRFILSYSIDNNDNIIQQLTEKKTKILKTLESLTYAFSWKAEHLLDTIGGLINFKFSSSIEKRIWDPYTNLSQQLTTSGKVSVDEDFLQWTSGAILKTFRLIDTPTHMHPLNMQNLIGDVMRDNFRINHPFFIHYGVHCPNQDKAESFFWRRSHLIDNQGKSQVLLRMIPELINELRECDQVRRVISQGERFVHTQFTAGVWADQLEIQQASHSIKNLYKINQLRLVENTCIHLPQFLSALPLSWGEYAEDLRDLKLLKTTISSECPCFIPIQGEWMGTPSAKGVLLIGRRGQLLSWDPFANMSGNYNCIVVGRSGSGKSVFMQELMLSGLGTGTNVYVLDVGRSFEKLCETVNGQHIEFTRDANICLNPFTFITGEDEDDKSTNFSFLKSIISCMAAPTQGTSDNENAIIEKAISCIWEVKKSEATISDIADWLNEQEGEMARNLGMMLTPYTSSGSYGKYFEGKNNVNFSNKMVLIELEELKNKPDLQTVVLQLFILIIANKAFLGDRKTPFFICIDEAWDLLRAKQTGPFIETLARRLRKYNGSLVIGTQSLEDFSTTPGAKTAFENSDWMCLLSQKGTNGTHTLAEKKLSEAQLKALASVTTRQGEYSEVLICDTTGNYSISRLILDPFSKLLYSTQAADYAHIKGIMKTGTSVAQAIEQLLAEKKYA